MKRRNTIILIGLFLFSFSFQSAWSQSAEKIKLQDKLATPTAKSGGGGTLEAYLFEDKIDINFLNNLGQLEIKIYKKNTNTIVYQQTVIAQTGGSVSINTTDWDEGEYVLLITDAYGGCAVGTFTIQEE